MAEKPVALITGVGSGTGAAIVRRFASDGFRVIALARSLDLTSVLARKLPDTHAAQCDVSEEGRCAKRSRRYAIVSGRRAFSFTMRCEEAGARSLRSIRRCLKPISG